MSYPIEYTSKSIKVQKLFHNLLLLGSVFLVPVAPEITPIGFILWFIWGPFIKLQEWWEHS